MNMIKYCKYVVIFSLSFPISGFAEVQEHYKTTIEEGHWVLHTKPDLCILSQNIPGYGLAEFYKLSGLPLQFGITLNQRPGTPLVRQAVVKRVPTEWQHEGEEKILAELDIDATRKSIAADAILSQQLLRSLEHGYQIRIFHPHFPEERGTVVVDINPVELKGMLPGFQDCMGNLPKVTLSSIHKVNVYFDTAAVSLGREAQDTLNDVLDMLKTKPDIRQIRLSGFTDSVGNSESNVMLSERRVSAVKEYLVDNGISDKLIEIHAFGMRHAISDNDSSSGRAHNRRVLIEVRE